MNSPPSVDDPKIARSARILAVDDEAANLRLLTALLEREGYTVFHSSAAFAPHAVYVEGAATPAPADLCDGARPRFAGGRWWLYRCAPVDF